MMPLPYRSHDGTDQMILPGQPRLHGAVDDEDPQGERCQ